MSHFLISKGKKPGDTVALESKDGRHLRDVLRSKIGERVGLHDEEGVLHVGRIVDLSNIVRIEILETLPKIALNGILKIGQSLLKKDKMEFVVQKATELGVSSLQPFFSSRSIAKLEKADKIQRWQKIADEATKQCGRGTLMKVETPLSFKDALRTPADLKIIFWEEGKESTREFLRTITACHDGVQTILVLVGPEGGFSKDEIEDAQKAGFTVLSLGPRILRAETASLVAMSLIQYELGNL